MPAQDQLRTITDRRIQRVIRDRIRELDHEPENQGKRLADELVDYRSVRAVGQRYRIIYMVKAEQVIVVVVTVGIRKKKDKKDAYALATRLARLGLLDLEEEVEIETGEIRMLDIEAHEE